MKIQRLLVLPLILLAAPLWRHFHPTHSWMEGKVRNDFNQTMAPATARDVSCKVDDNVATCDVTTSDGREFSLHLTKSGNTWSPDRAVRIH